MINSAIRIRPATPADVPQILRFVGELAEYERAADAVVASEADLHRDLFGAAAQVHVLLCERDGQAIGFALYFFNYSTWLGRHGLFLEDLYVTPAARGAGAGRQILRHLARIAVDKDCGRFEWNVLKWNAPAIGFYESLGARAQDEWVGYRMTGTALRNLADEA